MKILVTGARGMLGHDLCPVLSESHDVVGVDQEDADITDLAAVEKLVNRVRPDLVLHAAAFTDVDRAESCPDIAREVNAVGTMNVAKAALEADAVMAYVSTDYVFDGKKGEPYVEIDRPNPINVYGCSKYAGERVVQSMSKHYYVFRTAWLYAPHGKNFVNTIVRIAEETGRLEVVNDQIGTPTYTLDLAHAVNAILLSGVPGLYHTVNQGQCSWFDFAGEILRQTGIKAELKPTTTARFQRPAPRPRCSALATSRLDVEIGYHMRPWQEALADCLDRKREAAVQPNTQPAAAESVAIRTRTAR